MSLARRWRAVFMLALILTLALITACAGPDGAPAATSAAASPDATLPPTATAMVAPTIATTAIVPRPSGGAELRILGKTMTRVVSGDAEGKALYANISAGIARSDDGGKTWAASGAM